jgi:hypothetical protein
MQFSNEVLPHGWGYERPVFVFQTLIFSIVLEHILIIVVANVWFVFAGLLWLVCLQRSDPLSHCGYSS